MDLTKFLEDAKGLGVLGVRVTQHDELTASWDLEADRRRNIYSASKSFTSAAVGFAVEEGLISLDEKLTDAFADDVPEEVSEYLAMATVRDLLTMCLGQSAPHLMSAQRVKYEEDDWVKLALAQEFAYAPGTHFMYSNVGPYLAGILVQRRAGCTLVDYLMPRLFTPLGIKRPTWEVDPLGNTFGAGGLMLTLDELHRFGLLYLHKGEYQGTQILSREWVEESTKAQDDVKYAYLFWRGRMNSFRADGMYCQFAFVLPDQDAVVSMLCECRDDKKLKQAIYDDIFTQI